MRVLLLTPPFLQPNTPYPATCFLKAFLGSKGIAANQADLSLELLLSLFSPSGLDELKDELGRIEIRSDSSRFFLDAFSDYRATVDPVIRFLQGRDPSLADRIANRRFVPEGPRFAHLQQHGQTLLPMFGSLGLQDKAKYIASLYLDDIADAIKGADPKFELARYAEHLAESQHSFTPMYESLRRPTYIDRRLTRIFDEKIEALKPDLVGISVPFPGNLHAALRLGGHLKSNHPHVRSVIGGGFVNTELRNLNDPRIFEFIDYITYDDGEAPMLALIEHLQGRRKDLVRTRSLKNGRIEISGDGAGDIAFKDSPAPDYADLPLDRYISMLELPNPMHRMWSDFRWNKMMLAHGCYWKNLHFLRHLARLHPKIRTAKGFSPRRSNGNAHGTNRKLRISFCRRSGPTGAAQGYFGRNYSAFPKGQLVGKHSIRQTIRCALGRIDGGRGMHRGHRRP